MVRDFDRQTAELQFRIAILNRFTALGSPVTEPVIQAAGVRGSPALRRSVQKSHDSGQMKMLEWCPGAESNHRHEDFQSTALPLSYPGTGMKT